MPRSTGVNSRTGRRGYQAERISPPGRKHSGGPKVGLLPKRVSGPPSVTGSGPGKPTIDYFRGDYKIPKGVFLGKKQASRGASQGPFTLDTPVRLSYNPAVLPLCWISPHTGLP